MKKEYRFKQLKDLAELDKSQIDACLNDLKVWIAIRQQVKGTIMENDLVDDFNWLDDGISGVSKVSFNAGDVTSDVNFKDGLDSKESQELIGSICNVANVVADSLEKQ